MSQDYALVGSRDSGSSYIAGVDIMIDEDYKLELPTEGIPLVSRWEAACERSIGCIGYHLSTWVSVENTLPPVSLLSMTAI